MVSPGWIPVREAKKMLDVSDSFLTRLLRSGKINGKQVGREWLVDPVSLKAYETTRDRRPGPKKKVTE